jgi:hypothetical protein
MISQLPKVASVHSDRTVREGGDFFFSSALTAEHILTITTFRQMFICEKGVF